MAVERGEEPHSITEDHGGASPAIGEGLQTADQAVGDGGASPALGETLQEAAPPAGLRRSKRRRQAAARKLAAPLHIGRMASLASPTELMGGAVLECSAAEPAGRAAHAARSMLPWRGSLIPQRQLTGS